jgi:hypothetical protein
MLSEASARSTYGKVPPVVEFTATSDSRLRTVSRDADGSASTFHDHRSFADRSNRDAPALQDRRVVVHAASNDRFTSRALPRVEDAPPTPRPQVMPS